MSELLSWTDDMSVGVDVIDSQHKRIVTYINMLHAARMNDDREAIAAVLDGLVDYTLSHFGFEEALLAEARYRFLAPHKKVHELFERRLSEYQQRFALGEDIATEIQDTLNKWLINHIKREDQDYAVTVRSSLGEERLKQILKEERAARGVTLRKMVSRR